ncbi:MAG: 50S ribosomal protein L25 [Aeriscardovia sp.]|nr:50S ribosomal protein L25 [Aeriscardovia sp.]
MEKIELRGEEREEFGKGFSRRLRQRGRIPASVYSHGNTPIFFHVDYNSTASSLRNANAVYELELKGGEEKVMAVVKDVQRNPVSSKIESIDFYKVEKGEKIEVTVPVYIEGVTKGNSTALIEVQKVKAKADVDHLPQSLVLSIEGMQAGQEIRGKDIKPEEGVEFVGIKPEETLVKIVSPEGKKK